MNTGVVATEQIARTILIVRGQKVLLDSDLAQLYGVSTRVLNQALSRNDDRFPDDFAFTLSRKEIAGISQSVTSYARLKFSKHVRAFREQGVAMLSSVLRSERAVKVNIAITRAFVKLRETLENNRELAPKFASLEQRVDHHDGGIAAILDAIRQLLSPATKQMREIGFHMSEAAPRYRTRRVR